MHCTLSARMTHMVTTLFFIAQLITSSASFAVHFDLDREFPNYFKEFQAPDLSDKTLNDTLSKALLSCLERVNFRYRTEDGTVRQQGFFTALKTQVQKVDPKAEIYLQGDTVRSLLGYLYQKVYYAKGKNPALSAIEILNQITEENRTTKADRTIDSFKLFGISSPLQIRIHLPDAVDKRLSHLKLGKQIEEFIASAHEGAPSYRGPRYTISWPFRLHRSTLI